MDDNKTSLEYSNPLLIKCKKCGIDFSKRAGACPKCGAPQTMPCNICHAHIPINSDTCPKCGDPSPFDEKLLKEKIESAIEKHEDILPIDTETSTIQNKVDGFLRWGIIFSLLWLAGIGSLFAFILGLKAKKIIEESGGKISGIGRVWWCLIVGGLGMILWFPALLIGIVNNLR